MKFINTVLYIRILEYLPVVSVSDIFTVKGVLRRRISAIRNEFGERYESRSGTLSRPLMNHTIHRVVDSTTPAFSLNR
jgi:hypothetical protein